MSGHVLRESLTFAQTITQLAHWFDEAGLDAPRREARLAVAQASGLSLADLMMRETAPIGARAPQILQVALRRMKREPLSRIAGQREFMGLDFALNAETLDPRPETEHLVEAVLAQIRFLPAPHVLDLGTGSGAILIALLVMHPDASGLGVDLSAEACAMARENARRHHVDERAHFMVSDMAEAVSGRFDVVVSNPPYIATPDLAGLDAEVRVFDPVRALDGGADGLDFYRRLATDSRRLLKPSGTLAVEIGQGQEQDVAHLLCENGFNLLPFVADYAGIIRIIVAQAPFLVK